MSTSPMEKPNGERKRPMLLEHFKGTVSTPADTDTYRIDRWASQETLKAAYVVYPVDAADISLAIKFARTQTMSLAIRGGGHNSSGASSSEGGLVIDMRKMNSVRVDKEAMVGYIQGGTTVSQAQTELLTHGLATPLGHGGTVGVIGLAIGGGLGGSMGEHGLACDNIVSATMVLASGEIVHVSENENSDLLWGIKGGGSNFGVIAELGMRLHVPPPELYIIQLVYLPEQLPALVAELNAWLKVQTPQESLFLIMALGPDGTPVIALNGLGNFSAEEGERLWNCFLKLGPIVQKTAQIPFSKRTMLIDEVPVLEGPKITLGCHVNNFDYETVKKSYDTWLGLAGSAPRSLFLYEFYHYDLPSHVPLEAAAYPHRTKDYVVAILVQGFSDVGFVQEARKAAERLKECISSSSTESAKNSVGYINYADHLAADNTTDANARRAYGTNYPRLQQLKRKYDPEMVFNKWFCIRPSEIA
ncbi:hypothetical protein FRB96_003657 [Tulasnella sp. 330]|nr:hypothetical protein FRB96_003657 [Tulasnella sp. 330]KAG8885723.1 hypothetical protein FRB98_001676 [Tulasnella sp. 332]